MSISMPRWFTLALVSLLSLSALARETEPNRTLIRDVAIVDVRKQVITDHRDIITDSGRIVVIRPAKPGTVKERKKIDKVVKVYDGSKFFVTPGLVDAHVHFDLYAWEKQADDWSIPMYLSSGVTTVRDCAGSHLTLDIREKVENHAIFGPRMVIASPFITSEKVEPGSNVYQVVDAADARARVNSFLDMGYDGIKTDSYLNDDVYFAAAEAAEARKSYLFGHTLGDERNGFGQIFLSQALDHYRTLEHFGFAVYDFMQSLQSPYYHNPKMKAGHVGWFAGAYMDFYRGASLIKLMRAKHGVISPTFVTEVYDDKMTDNKDKFLAMSVEDFRKDPFGQYLPDYYYDMWTYMYKNWTWPNPADPRRMEIRKGLENSLKLLKMLDDADVSIIAGTDVPARPYLVAGKSLHEELALYRKAGLNPWRVLRTATLNPAKAFGLAGMVGEIREGAFADLVFTKDNPVRDLGALAHPQGVMTHGDMLTESFLKILLARQKEQVRKIPTPAIRFSRVHVDTPPRFRTLRSR